MKQIYFALFFSLLVSVASAAPSSYKCAIERQSSKKTTSESFTLAGSKSLIGWEPHEQVTLKITPESRVIVVNEFSTSPSDPYILKQMTCDKSLNCSGQLSTYNKHKKKDQPFVLEGHPEQVVAKLGTSPVFVYRSTATSFSFQSVQSVENKKIIGSTIQCRLL